MGHIFKLYLQSPGPPLLYLHFLPDAFAAEVLDFVEVVCSEAAYEGKHHSQLQKSSPSAHLQRLMAAKICLQC